MDIYFTIHVNSEVIVTCLLKLSKETFKMNRQNEIAQPHKSSRYKIPTKYNLPPHRSKEKNIFLKIICENNLFCFALQQQITCFHDPPVSRLASDLP